MSELSDNEDAKAKAKEAQDKRKAKAKAREKAIIRAREKSIAETQEKAKAWKGKAKTTQAVARKGKNLKKKKDDIGNGFSSYCIII